MDPVSPANIPFTHVFVLHPPILAVTDCIFLSKTQGFRNTYDIFRKCSRLIDPYRHIPFCSVGPGKIGYGGCFIQFIICFSHHAQPDQAFREITEFFAGYDVRIDRQGQGEHGGALVCLLKAIDDWTADQGSFPNTILHQRIGMEAAYRQIERQHDGITRLPVLRQKTISRLYI